MGKPLQLPSLLPADDCGMGGEREERKDAAEAAGEDGREFGRE
jgi:hypothetical protein